MLSRLLLVAAAAGALAAQDAALRPYEIQWNVEGPVAADLSFLLEAPAGKHGFVRVENGHLFDGQGRRLRLWGVNFSFTASLPAKEHAPLVAAHLARFGVNCVRIHHLDWRTPRGIIDSRFPDSRHLDPASLDRLDYLIAELKKRGIYVDLNLNIAREFRAADGVVDAGRLGFAKGITLFDPRIIELEMRYARRLLTHRNRYTGNQYRNEPAVAVVEIVNENSLLESWKGSRLLGKGPEEAKGDQTWSDITAHYERELTALYRKYLATAVTADQFSKLRAEAGVAPDAPLPRLRPDQFKAASELRFQTEAAFYIGLETSFYARMKRLLKDDLRVRAPVIGTSAHNGGLSAYPLLTSVSQLDIIDTHTYWQHPRYFTDPASGKQAFEIRNTPMVNEPEKSTVVALHRAAMLGRPFMVTEVNHPYPNEWAAEMIPVLAAYGSFLDWDGIFWYSFSHQEAGKWQSSYPGYFDIRQDPVKMTQLAVAALMFLRGDAQVSRSPVARSYSSAQVRESLRLPAAEAPNFTPGMSPALALVHDVRIRSLTAGPAGDLPAASRPYVSDTGELRWAVNDGSGIVTIDTPCAQGVAGFAALAKPALTNLVPEIDNRFAAILLVSMDGKPVSRAARLLLTAGARTGNTGMRWNEKRTTLLETGTGPVLIEPVTGSLLLRGIEPCESIDLQPLDGGGRALGTPSRATRTSGGWRIKLGEVVTPWYQLTITRVR